MLYKQSCAQVPVINFHTTELSRFQVTFCGYPHIIPRRHDGEDSDYIVCDLRSPLINRNFCKSCDRAKSTTNEPHFAVLLNAEK